MKEQCKFLDDKILETERQIKQQTQLKLKEQNNIYQINLRGQLYAYKVAQKYFTEQEKYFKG